MFAPPHPLSNQGDATAQDEEDKQTGDAEMDEQAKHKQTC